MDESLRQALLEFLNQHGQAAVSVYGIELAENDYDEEPTIDIKWMDSQDYLNWYEVNDSHLQDLLLFLLRSVAK